MENNKSFVYVLITAFCFGTMETALKLGGGYFDSVQLTFLRFLIGGLLLLPFAVYDLKKRSFKLSVGDIVYLVTLGIVCVCLSMTIFQIGIMKTNAALAALIISANPVFTMIFAHFLTGDKFTKRKLASTLICLTGLFIAAEPASLIKGNNLEGVALVLVASVAFGFYTALGKRRIAKIGGFTQNSLSFIFGAAALAIFLAFTNRPVVAGITLSSLPLLLYLGVVVTGIGYWAFLKAIAAKGPNFASVSFYIKPVIAMLAALIVLGDNITPLMIIGALIVIFGSALNTLPKKSVKHGFRKDDLYGTKNSL